MPNKKEAKKFIIEILLILNPALNLKLFCIKNLKVNPHALPIKRNKIELIFKI